MMSDTFVAYMHPNEIGFNFHRSLAGLQAHDQGRHIACIRDLRVAAGALDNGRNTVTADFLNSTHEWMLFIDADMGFNPDVLDLLHAAADPVDRPVIGGLCFSQRDLEHDQLHGYRWQPKPTLFTIVEEPGKRGFINHEYYPVNQLVKCDATGGAMLLIHRSVFHRIGGDWWTRLPDTAIATAGFSPYASEDISFSVRCRAAGIPIHVYTAAKTNHLKETWISEPDFWARFDAPPATERVDVIVPVLHRPQNVRPFMQSLLASTGLATAWFVCERDDREQQDTVLEYGGRVLRCDGTFAEKVNYAFNKIQPPAPWVFLAGDDVQFRPGWLDHAQFVAVAYNASVVGTNDLGNPRVVAGEHATHMLIRRTYIAEQGASWDGPGVVCHQYHHWCVDDEIVTVAKQRGLWQMATGAIVEHMHHLWGKAAEDDVYAKGTEHAAEDIAEYQARLADHSAVAA